MKTLLLLPHIKVQGANAYSSPYTIGFPAVTAFMGAMHALQRFLNKNDDYKDLKISSTGIISHNFSLRTHKGVGDFVSSIIGTANPAVPSRSDAKNIKKNDEVSRPSFIETPLCNLDVSLVMEVEGFNPSWKENLEQLVRRIVLSKLRIAGGDILAIEDVKLIRIDEDEDEGSVKRILNSLMPGFALIERRDIMIEEMKDGNDAIDALLNALKVTNSCSIDEKTQKPCWERSKKYKGWIVPIGTGFLGVSDFNEALNRRDTSVLHRFAESIVTIGEFVMPYRLNEISDIMWKYEYKECENLYICTQN